MSDQDVTVRIIADTSAFDAPVLKAAASTQALSASAAELQGKAAAASLVTNGLASEFATVAPVASRAAVATQAVAAANVEATTATTAMHGSISTATREFRALFDELSSGRTRMTPGTLAIIGQRVFGLSIASLAAIGGLTALTAAIGYLIVKSIEAENAFNRFNARLSFEGNANVSAAAMDRLAQSIGADGAEIVGSWARVQGATVDSIQGMTEATQLYIAATGEKAPEAVKTLQSILDSGKASLADFAKAGIDLSDAEMSMWKQAELSNDPMSKMDALITIITDHIGKAHDAVVKADSGWTSWANDIRLTAAAIQDYTGGLIGLSSIIEGAIISWNALRTSIDGATTALKGYTSWIPGFNAQSVVQQRIIDATAAKLDAEAAAAHRAADALRNMPQASGAEMQYESDPGKKPGKPKNTSGFANIGDEEISQVQAQILQLQADYDLADAERFSKEQALWAALLAGDTLNAKQRATVNKTMEDERIADLKRTQKEAETLAKGEGDTEISLARSALAAKKDMLAEELKAHQISAAEWQAQSQANLASEEQLDIEALQLKYSNRDKDKAQYAAYVDELLKIYEKYWQDVHRQDVEGVAAHNAELIAQVNESKAAFNDITRASDTMIADMISGQKTFAQAAISVLATWTEKTIQELARQAIIHVMYTQQEITADKALQEGAWLWNMLFATKTTTAEAAQDTARATAAATAETASQTGITAAVTAGVAARAAVEATSRAAQAAANIATVQGDAAVGAAGAYAATAAIPIVGPALAPAAAATAFAAIEAYGSLAAFEQGTMDVGGTGIAMLHEGEAVMPPSVASTMRDFFGGNGAAAQGGGDIHVHNHFGFIDGPSGAAWLKSNGRAIAQSIAQQVRNLNSNLSTAPR